MKVITVNCEACSEFLKRNGRNLFAIVGCVIISLMIWNVMDLPLNLGGNMAMIILWLLGGFAGANASLMWKE